MVRRGSQRGAAMVEYALVISVLVLAVAAVLALLEQRTRDYQVRTAHEIGGEQVSVPTFRPTTTTTVPTTTTTSTTTPPTSAAPTSAPPSTTTTTTVPTTTTTRATTTTTAYVPGRG